MLVQLLIFIVLGVYVQSIGRWIAAWKKKNESGENGKRQTFVPQVTIIIAVRNESPRIPALMQALREIEYPSDKLEILVSDDDSEDGTVTLVESMKSGVGYPIRVIRPEGEHATGKKAALARAISLASGEIIVTTDADCSFRKYWIRSLVQPYRDEKIEMVTGMVRLGPLESWFEKLQALEFLSLAGSGAASVLTGHPVMCNGANLSFRKKAFYDTGGYKYGQGSVTGDDTFLMLSLHDQNPGSVAFAHSSDCVVTSCPVNTFRGFLSQRLRWISKLSLYKDPQVMVAGVITTLVNLALLGSLLLAVMQSIPAEMAVAAWLIKGGVDFIFLMRVTQLTGDRRLLFLFLPVFLVYPFYYLTGIVAGLFRFRYQWKGRKYNP